MEVTATVDRPATKRLETVSAKYPVDRKNLLRAVQARRGDTDLSDTVRAALDGIIERHLPGALVAPESGVQVK